MIKSFKSRRLRKLFERGDGRSIPPQQIKKIEYILMVLEASITEKDMDQPGFALHKIGGNYLGFWSVSVHGPWRIIFRFEREDAIDVDYLDYH